MSKKNYPPLIVIFLVTLLIFYSAIAFSTQITTNNDTTITEDSHENGDNGDREKGNDGEHGKAGGQKGKFEFNPKVEEGKGSGNKGGPNNDDSKGKGGNKGGQGGWRGDDETGKATLTVKVEFNGKENLGGLPEVEVTLIKEGDAPDFVSKETKTTYNQEVQFLIEPVGIYTIKGSPLPGYTIPEEELRLEEDEEEEDKEGEIIRDYEITLVYNAADIAVDDISLNKSKITLIDNVGIETLTATISPANASNQEVDWKIQIDDDSDSPVVSSPNLTGKTISLIAENTGTATVTARSSENETIHATCQVEVATVDGYEINEINAYPGQLVVLPVEVEAVLSNNTTQRLPVSRWEYNGIELDDFVFQVPINDSAPNTIILNGIVLEGFVDKVIELKINVNPTGNDFITLDKIQVYLFTGEFASEGDDTEVLTATMNPSINTDIVWRSSDTDIITVEADKEEPLQAKATITAVATGTAYITATADGHQAYCQVSVSKAPEVDLIYTERKIGNTGLYEPLETYDTREEIYINVEGLNITETKTYFVKVEHKGDNPILGEGSIVIDSNTIRFNLYDVTEFEKTDNYSNEYFAYISENPEFPRGDDEDGLPLTFMTNFKIGTAVPTVPEELLEVTVEMKGGSTPPEGIRIILCRLLDEDVTKDWFDYLDWDDIPINEDTIKNDPYLHQQHLVFVDEVKMYGTVNEEGRVIWEKPRETLKLGGYLLLEVTPKGYINNLNMKKDDGSLLKEVHLWRINEYTEPIRRNIVNTFIGTSQASEED